MSSLDRTDIAWQRLRSGEISSGFPVSTVKLDLDAGHGSVRLAIGQDGAPQLLVPTGLGRSIPDGLSGPAVNIRAVQYVVDGRAQNFIEIRSTHRHLDDVFRRLVDDVLRRLADGATPEQSVAQGIHDLRDLMMKELSRKPTFIVGLFGELQLLEFLLRTNRSAVQNWIGPSDQRFDFSGTRACAEVKSSVTRSSTIVHISSLEQLRPADDGRPLVLVHFALERAGSGGRSVRDLIEAARSLTANPAVLDAALEALELQDWRQDATLDRERFSVFAIALYRVEASFPRLAKASFVGGAVPNGISGIEYDLDLARAAAYRIEDSQVDNVVALLAETE